MPRLKRFRDDIARGIGSSALRKLLKFQLIVNALIQRYGYLAPDGKWKCSVCHLVICKDPDDPLIIHRGCKAMPSFSVAEMRDCGMIKGTRCVACRLNIGETKHECVSSLFRGFVLDISDILSTDNGALPSREYDALYARLRSKYQGHVVVVMQVPYPLTQLPEVLALPQEVRDAQFWLPPSPTPPELDEPAPPAEVKGKLTKAGKAEWKVYEAKWKVYEAERSRLEAEWLEEQSRYEERFNANEPRRLMRFHAVVSEGGKLHKDGLGVFNVLPTSPPKFGKWQACVQGDVGFVRRGGKRLFVPFDPIEFLSPDYAQHAQHPELQTFVVCTYSGIRIKTVDVPDSEMLESMREGEEEDAEYSICPRPSGIGFLLNCAHGKYKTCNDVLLMPHNKTFLYVNKLVRSGKELSWDYKAKPGSDADRAARCNCKCNGPLYP